MSLTNFFLTTRSLWLLRLLFIILIPSFVNIIDINDDELNKCLTTGCWVHILLMNIGISKNNDFLNNHGNNFIYSFRIKWRILSKLPVQYIKKKFLPLVEFFTKLINNYYTYWTLYFFIHIIHHNSNLI